MSGSDQYIETSETSWFGRIGNSLMGALFGIIILLVAFPLEWWNEGRSVNRAKTLHEGKSIVVPISPATTDATNNGKLIHFTGTATTDEVLQDTPFGVKENALKLARHVEMYQWEEKEHSTSQNRVGGGQTTTKTYTYDKVWSDKAIASANFKQPQEHQNPASIPYPSQTFAASDIKVGAFKLSNDFVNKINYYTDYPLTQQNYDALEPALKTYFTLNGDQYLYGDNANPQIGAVRIKFKIIKPLEISAVGKQTDSILAPYYTKHVEISLIEKGTASPDTMFKNAEDKNMMLTWGIRFGGIFLMWLGLALIGGPLKALAMIIPFFGEIAGVGIGLIAGLVALALSLTTIALAWLFYRPLIAVALIALAGGAIYALKYRAAQKKTLVVQSAPIIAEEIKSSSTTKPSANQW